MMTAKRQKAEHEAPAGKPYLVEDQIGFLIRRAHQRASAIFEQVMDGMDVTPVQYAALAKRGLVSPSVDPNDARLVLLALTPTGRDIVEQMKARGPEVSARTLEPLSAEEAETLLALLARIG